VLILEEHMAKKTVEAMVAGGKASAAPPLGPALGPLGLNIGMVISEINKKTAAFSGMQVPIKIIVDESTKEFTITVGTPPISSLIFKEANIEKGSGKPNKDKVADVRIEQIIKVAKMKEDSLLGKTLKQKVKEVIGSCVSAGILVQGVEAKKATELVNAGKFDEEIRTEKTELTAEELRALEEEKKRLAAETARRIAEEEAKAKAVVDANPGKEKSFIKAKLIEAGISTDMITKTLAGLTGVPGAGTAAGAAAGAAGTAAPGTPAAPGAKAAEKKTEKKA
jgi:large subunit ribosomal protein L11